MAYGSLRTLPEGHKLPVEDGLVGKQVSELPVDVGEPTVVAVAVWGPTPDLATAGEFVGIPVASISLRARPKPSWGMARLQSASSSSRTGVVLSCAFGMTLLVDLVVAS